MPPASLLRHAFHKLPAPVQSTIRQVVSPVRSRAGLVRRLARPRAGEAPIKVQSIPAQGIADLWAVSGVRSHLHAKIVAALPAIEGWCTERKAVWLAELLAKNCCSTVLEIGVFGGRSLIPMAFAVQQYAPGGKVYGVDAWSSDLAVETGTSAENDEWWRTIELKAIKTGFLRNVLDNELAGVVNVLEMSSDEAFKCLTAIGPHEFDLIHVDGSHSEAQALRDVQTWSSLLRPGGILVLGDISWPSAQRARDYVKTNLAVIEEVFELDGVAYGAYRRRP